MAAAKGGTKNVASMNPDDMLQGGLADDFDGEITKARYIPWTYPDGSVDHNLLAVVLQITPDEDSGLQPFNEFYSAGDLAFFAPSNDGENPVDGDLTENWATAEEGDKEALEGIYALRVGTRQQLANNTKWAEFVTAALNAGYDKSKLDPSTECWEGVRGHMNRIPQRRRSGVVSEEGGEGKRARTILVLTQVDTSTKAKPVSAGKPAASKPTSTKTDDDGLSSDLADLIVTALAENDGSITKAKIVPLVMKSFEGSKRAKAVKLGTDVKFLKGSELWSFNAETGTLTLS